MNFKEWLNGYNNEYKRELKEWHDKNPNFKSVIPAGLDEQLIQQYSAYRSELATKKLVIVTWCLAIATTILAIISIFIK